MKDKTKYAKNTPQSMSDGFQYYTKILTEIIFRFSDRQDDSEIASLYSTYRYAVKFWTRLHKGIENCPDPKDLPTLKENNNNAYTALQSLAEYCGKVKVKRQYKRWQDLLPIVETYVKEGRFENQAKLKRDLECSKGTVVKIVKHSDILKKEIEYNKTHPKTHKVKSSTKEILNTIEDSAPEPLPSITETNEIFAELLERVLKEQPKMYEQTKKEISNMDDEGKRRFAQVYEKSPTPLKTPKTQTQYKQL